MSSFFLNKTQDEGAAIFSSFFNSRRPLTRLRSVVKNLIKKDMED